MLIDFHLHGMDFYIGGKLLNFFNSTAEPEKYPKNLN